MRSGPEETTHPEHPTTWWLRSRGNGRGGPGAKAECAANPPERAEEAAKDNVEIDIDLMESAELREALEAAGFTQPDDATDADMRVAHKRVLDSFTHAATAHKRKKKARSAPF
jgi:hypothetical protein